MKIFKIFLTILFVIVLILLTVAYFFIRSFDANTYKPQLVAAASQWLGQDVQMGDIRLSFSMTSGLALDVRDIAVRDLPAFSSQNVVDVGRLQGQLDFMTFLMKRELHVSQIEIFEPRVHVIKDTGGINLLASKAFGGEGKAGESAQGPAPQEPAEETLPRRSSQDVPAPQQINFFIRSVKILDGSVEYVDKTRSFPLKIPVTDIDVVIDRFALSRPFDFDVRAAFFAIAQNIRMDGSARLDPAQNGFLLQGVQVRTDLSDLSLPLLVKAVPPLGKNALSVLEGSVNADIRRMKIVHGEIAELSAKGDLSNGRVFWKDFPIPLNNISIRWEAPDKNSLFLESAVRPGTGFLEGKGEVKDFLKRQEYTFQGNVKDVAVEEIVAAFSLPLQFKGEINANLTFAGQGLDEPGIRESLTGKGAAFVEDGRIENINVLRVVLSQISLIPNLYEKIMAGLPEKYKEQLKREDTLFEKMTTAIQIQGTSVRIQEIDIIGDSFSLAASGTIDIDQNLVMKSEIFIPADLSAVMVDAVQELAGLLESDGRIRIPLSDYQGKASGFKPLPDLAYLGKKLIMGRGKEEIKKLIDKALGREEEEVPQQPPPTGEGEPGGESRPAPEGEEPSPEEQIIEGIMDIFGLSRLPINTPGFSPGMGNRRDSAPQGQGRKELWA